jgi:uncharacterized cupredoxin-like copper-binding protein
MLKQRCAFGLFFVLLLLVFVGCGRDGITTSSGSPTGTRDVQVTLTDFKVSSSMTTFSAGTPYHFVVKNDGKTAHEFMVMQPMAMGNMPMGQMDKMAYTSIGTLNPGEIKSVDYTFASSVAGKSIEFSCHLPGHYEAGMKLPITVTP